MLYDVFICHASEDKDTIVRSLAEMLQQSHVEVWYDEFSLDVGDSIRESIDKGLSKSRFGIVVLSKSFFAKKWTNWELNGLLTREMSSDERVVLPVWHNIARDEVMQYSPSLADRKALDTSKGIDLVCNDLLRKIRPQESPLIVARDELIHYGLKPPVITDEWWLDVVEASKKLPCWGYFPPEDSSWGRWTFPLPNFGGRGADRGVRLAWTALQMGWEREADERAITQITKPDEVLAFINSQPGLAEACHDTPLLLACYAPQLTIRGFGGEFESDFDKLLTTKSKKNLPFRLDDFGGSDPAELACEFVQGDMGGPQVRYYEIFDYLIWLISSDSQWLPSRLREYLILGVKEWNVWWHSSSAYGGIQRDFMSALFKAKSNKAFKMAPKANKSLLNWIEHSLKNIRSANPANDVLKNFLAGDFIDAFFREKRKKK